MSDISDLVGMIVTEVEYNNDPRNDYGGSILLTLKTIDKVYDFKHYRDCCETVYFESSDGDLNELVGKLILDAEESTNQEADKYGDSTTWTFYKIRTIDDTYTLRFVGASNGYYSESVSFEERGND